MARQIDVAAAVVGETDRIASCEITSGVCVEGSRLTRPEIRQAASPTVKR